jgi:hypothetical protein
MGRWKLRRDAYDPTLGVIQGTGAKPGPITEARASGHRDFFKTNWELLAFHAWRGYQAEGRGSLVLWERELHTHGRYMPRPAHLAYLGERNPKFPRHIDDSYIAKAIREYDPRREVLISINLREGGVAFHRIRRGFVDPPDAKPNAN